MLDNLDMFAAKAKQTVLYYLLDSMQIPETQVRIASLTTPLSLAWHVPIGFWATKPYALNFLTPECPRTLLPALTALHIVPPLYPKP